MQWIGLAERCRSVAVAPAPSPARRGLLSALVVASVAGPALGMGGCARSSRAADGPAAPASDSTTSTAPSSTTTTAPSTTTTVPPTTTTTVPPPAGADGTLELGEEGAEVAALQEHLDQLGYWHGASDGTYGQLTRQAVMAFQKAEGLGRDGVAGPITQFALGAAVRPAPREASGNHLEIDLGRQILLVVEGGQTKWVLNTSTGSGEAYASPRGGTAVATTPAGRFAINREVDGLREAPLGTLYRPKYFVGGIAIHGSGSIPAHHASHGCARVTNGAMDLLWSSGLAVVGTPVLTY
jgi:peptidoglycan hydrolase-like protein with peptidoglycan-binding domain